MGEITEGTYKINRMFWSTMFGIKNLFLEFGIFNYSLNNA